MKKLLLVILLLTIGFQADARNIHPGIVRIVAKPVCSGGTHTTANGKDIYTFTTSGTLTCTSGGLAEVLVIAGGGGGEAGGGGAGGYIDNTAYTLTAQAYTVTVGDGGTKGAADGLAATNGGNSVFDSLTAIGGGAGGWLYDYGAAGANGVSGGSGGGGGDSSTNTTTGGGHTAGQGNDGAGNNGITAVPYVSGGGGGAGGAGSFPADSTHGGLGGVGISNSISGASVCYAGGGGGGVYLTPSTAGTATCGGGNGNSGYQNHGADGTANTGGGGGGSGQGDTVVRYSGQGGSGVVIVSF